MGLLRRSTSNLFSAGPTAVPTGNGAGPQLTLPRQSETVGSATGLGGRRDADQGSGNIGSFRGCFFAARRRSRCADRAAGDADRAGVAGSRRRAVRPAPGSTAAEAASYLSALSGGTRRRLSTVFPRLERRAGVQCGLCAGIPAQRHRDRAPHELPLAPRLSATGGSLPVPVLKISGAGFIFALPRPFDAGQCSFRQKSRETISRCGPVLRSACYADLGPFIGKKRRRLS